MGWGTRTKPIISNRHVNLSPSKLLLASRVVSILFDPFFSSAIAPPFSFHSLFTRYGCVLLAKAHDRRPLPFSPTVKPFVSCLIFSTHRQEPVGLPPLSRPNQKTKQKNETKQNSANQAQTPTTPPNSREIDTTPLCSIVVAKAYCCPNRNF